MAGHDPFAEPDDSERTVIRPNPAGRRAAAGAAPAGVPAYAAPQAAAPAGYGVPQREAPAPAAPSGGGEGKAGESPIALAMTGMNRLNATAATLFALVSRIRNRAQHVDPEALRRNVVAEVRSFESRAISAGVDPQQVKVARYAICATIDDVVLNTPWGEQSSWGMQSMVGTFHKETVGGDRFYDVLARLEKDPPNNIELLEFMYMCLSLGFDGRLRVEAGGVDKHMQVRNGLARIIRAQRGAVEQDLSPRWRGVEKPHRALSAWKPVYIALATTATVLALMFATLTYLLGNNSDRVIGALATLNSTVPPVLDRPAPPPPPPPPPPPEAPPDQAELIAGFLEPEIADGLVKVFQTATTITVRVKGVGMFASGSDQLSEGYPERIDRLAKALKDQPGKLLIVGHSDNVPIKSRRFKSNMALSLARAETVKNQMAAILGEDRLSAEGRADAEPVCNDGSAACEERNNSREGRDENRRIEIILLKAES